MMMMMMMILSDILEFFNMDPSQENFLLSSPSLISLSESPATSSISLLFISLFMLYTSVHIWKGLRLSETFKNVIKIRHSALSLSFTRWLRQFEDARSSASLYLNEKYLRVVKLANRSDDSKSVVDRPTKRPLKEVLEALKCLNEANLDEIKIFVDKYLHEPGYEIENAHFCDWQSRPKFIEYLNEEDLIEFSLALNRIWLDLYKRVNTSKLSDGGVSSHLPMRHPFVVPGGRFREFYYWDTYWTMEGLLVCGMRQTARKMLENLIDLVLTYGFIPNGTRIYYLNRSQPPYFAQMVEKYYESCMHAPDLDSEAKSECERFVLEEALPCLIKEYDFWMSERTAKTNHYEFDFNIFRADTNKPRPESYLEDIETAKMYNNEKDREKLFMDIASAAESGYDFCSRWFGNLMSLSTIETTNIIPVDLNSVMYKNELIIAELCFKKGLYSRGDDFKRAAVRRNRAINRVLWSNEDLCWSDYNMAKRELNRNFYVTNLSPLWMDVLPPDGITVNRIIEKHRQFLHSFDAGVPVSSINNGQQWDFPNVWAPNQYSVVHGLLKHNHDDLALSIARKFFKSVHSGWKRTGCIYEKYSAVYSGERGSGGEYEVQSGFGWTNGVILSFIRTYKDQIIQSNENNNKKS